ncbi:hypothetical protein [Streptomyces sp. NTH33]|uniref:hypothetical protein n=1 Tax=Streptomyces sp. NTH33 TaxID=1735453 RepID=UPI0021AD0214|nr:hypothetical protein [Streptomyces sp. NTH33]
MDARLRRQSAVEGPARSSTTRARPRYGRPSRRASSPAAVATADTDIDLVGVIGRRVLTQLLPARRVRTKDRIVKRAISKYNARGP